MLRKILNENESRLALNYITLMVVFVLIVLKRGGNFSSLQADLDKDRNPLEQCS